LHGLFVIMACKQTENTQTTVDTHSKLYPTIENRQDRIECTDADFAPYRFEYDQLEEAIQYLVQNGHVVIKNVFDAADLDKGKSLMWDFLSAQSIGWKRNDYKTWNIYNVGGELQNGLLWGKGMGHSKFQWFTRTHPRVLQVFGAVWSHPLVQQQKKHGLEASVDQEEPHTIDPCKDLLTSFDGIGLFVPWYMTGEVDRTNAGWYHIDQNPTSKKGIHTIQGYVTYFDQNESTGSTVFIPGTHSQVGKVLNVGPMAGDFIRIPKHSPLLNSKNYKKILLSTRSGDLVLWDSRTIHCSSPALLSQAEMKKVHVLEKKKKKAVEKQVEVDALKQLNGVIDSFENKEESDQKNDQNESESGDVDLLRLVSMVCMVPKSKLKNKNIIKRRVKSYQDKSTLSHWPTEYSVLHCPSNVEKNLIEEADALTKSLIGM